MHFPSEQYLTYPINICLVILLLTSVSPAPPLSVFAPCCVCVTCLCGNPRWRWLRPRRWFTWHICHTHVCQKLLLLGLRGKASFVDFLSGWLIDPWPRYHLLPLTPLLINVTLDSLTAPTPPLFHHTHACMITRREEYGKINTCNSRS